jgi:hypothetical protein
MYKNKEGENNNGFFIDTVRFFYALLTPRLFTIIAIAGLLTFLENGGIAESWPWFISLLLANTAGILVMTRLLGEIGIMLIVLVREWYCVFCTESNETADALPHIVAKRQKQFP